MNDDRFVKELELHAVGVRDGLLKCDMSIKIGLINGLGEGDGTTGSFTGPSSSERMVEQSVGTWAKDKCCDRR